MPEPAHLLTFCETPGQIFCTHGSLRMTAFLVLLIAPRVTSNLANIASCHAKPILRLTRMTDPNDEQFVLNGIFRFVADLTDS